MKRSKIKILDSQEIKDLYGSGINSTHLRLVEIKEEKII